VTGWTLDFMRRSGTGFKGSMEFLIANAALTLRTEGYSFLSLSGAPLARALPGPQPLWRSWTGFSTGPATAWSRLRVPFAACLSR
jgi:lysylphosphatidylglycerol synthetase-like protein (DUF2156 family)